jgi:hypothetical protein
VGDDSLLGHTILAEGPIAEGVRFAVCGVGARLHAIWVGLRCMKACLEREVGVWYYVGEVYLRLGIVLW